jgi:two-component system, LytTR family, response regulator
MKKDVKIVLIEDEAALRETLTELLEISGYQVATASDGKEGYELILASQPDLVLCDINMPRMDGFEVLSVVNRKYETGLPPAFLFLSARVQLEDIKQGLKLGADDYIAKPIKSSDLLDSIKMRLLKRRKLLEHGNMENESPINMNSSYDKFGIPSSEGLRFIKFESVIRFEADRAYCHIFLTNGKKMVASKSMSEFQPMLEKSGFIKVHKSHIVNLKHVESFIRGKGGQLVMSDGSLVNVSLRKKEVVLKSLRAS